MLLIGSGMLIRSFLLLQRADLGCDPHRLLTFRYRLPQNVSASRSAPIAVFRLGIERRPGAAITRVFERLQSLPGVRSAAGSVYPPLTGGNPMTSPSPA